MFFLVKNVSNFFNKKFYLLFLNLQQLFTIIKQCELTMLPLHLCDNMMFRCGVKQLKMSEKNFLLKTAC